MLSCTWGHKLNIGEAVYLFYCYPTGIFVRVNWRGSEIRCIQVLLNDKLFGRILLLYSPEVFDNLQTPTISVHIHMCVSVLLLLLLLYCYYY